VIDEGRVDLQCHCNKTCIPSMSHEMPLPLFQPMHPSMPLYASDRLIPQLSLQHQNRQSMSRMQAMKVLGSQVSLVVGGILLLVRWAGRWSVEHLYNTPTNGRFQFCAVSCNLDLSVCTVMNDKSAMLQNVYWTALTSMGSAGPESDRMGASSSTATQY
jgi:hypothetical protein